MIKKFLTLLTFGSLLYFGVAFAAPTIIYQRTILPEVDSTYELGTSTQAWLRANVDELCLTGDSCKTAWPSGVGSATSTEPLMASWFVATSTTATSTFAGGLNVDGGNFIYDYSTNRVGIGTTSPSTLLTVHTTETTSPFASVMAGDATHYKKNYLSIGQGNNIATAGCIIGDPQCTNVGYSGDVVVIGDQNILSSTAQYVDLMISVGSENNINQPRYVTNYGNKNTITAAPSITIGQSATNNASYGIMFSSLGGVMGSGCANGLTMGSQIVCTHAGSYILGWGAGSERAYELVYGARNAATTTSSFRLMGSTSLFLGRSVFSITTQWNPDMVSDGTRRSIASLNVYDYNSGTTPREFFRGEATGGNQTLALFLNSKVAIGTTTPYAPLSVWATSTTPHIAQFINSASSTVMTINSDGNIGIGTTTPYAKLSVVGETVVSNLTATSSTATSTFSTGMLFNSGKAHQVKVGANMNFGTTTLVAGAATVNNTQTQADSLIFLSDCAGGGTLGSLYVGTRVAGTSFDINSTNALDTSTVCWNIYQPLY